MAKKLSRTISLNITHQQDGDCFAHAISRVLVKAYRKLYPNELSFKRPELSVSEDPKDRCVSLYNIPNAFYKCEGTSNECYPVSMKSIEKKCTDTETLNLLLYMHFWSTIVNKFGCNGAFPSIAFYFFTHPMMLYNLEEAEHGIDCNLQLPMCNKLQTFFKIVKRKKYPPQVLIPYSFRYNFHILSTYNFINISKNNEHGINIEYSDRSICNPVIEKIFFKKGDLRKIQNVNYAPGKYPNPCKMFFEKIEYILKKSLYLVLTGAASFFQWKADNPKKIYTGQDVILPHEGHCVTIVGYDYSDPSNKMLQIKNSWGIGIQGHQYEVIDDKVVVTTMNIYESEMIAFSKKYDNDDTANVFEIDYVDCLPFSESIELFRNVFKAEHPSEIFVVPADEFEPHIPSRLHYKIDTPENSKLRNDINIEKKAEIEKERIRLRDHHLHSKEYTDEYSKMYEQEYGQEPEASSWFSIPKFRAGTRKKIKKNKKTRLRKIN